MANQIPAGHIIELIRGADTEEVSEAVKDLISGYEADGWSFRTNLFMSRSRRAMEMGSVTYPKETSIEDYLEAIRIAGYERALLPAIDSEGRILPEAFALYTRMTRRP